MNIEELQEKLSQLRKDYSKEKDPIKKEVIKRRAFALQRTTLYLAPDQKKMRL